MNVKKIDRIIKALRMHGDFDGTCRGCPYVSADSPDQGCTGKLCEDTLSVLNEYKDDLRIMFNRCHTLIHSCDACTIKKTCKQLRDVDKKVGEYW